MTANPSSSKSRRRAPGIRPLWLALLMLALAASGAGVLARQSDSGSGLAQEREMIVQWRKSRDASLRQDHGWLSLVGLDWLGEGENRIGSAEGNDIRLPGGPDHWGTIVLTGDLLVFRRAPGSDVTVNGASDDEVELVADNAGEPTVIQSGTLNVHVIFRESYGLRVSDSQAPARLNFSGVPNYEIQPDWRIEGALIPAEAGETIEVGNVLGQVSPNPVLGTFEFERGGAVYRLVGLGDETSESVWFIFADRTNGHGTYGAGRFLYSEGLPRDGRLVVDFNKAYNPPCAFNEYSTCPLPPQANRLDLAVTAGEMDIHRVAGE